MQAAINAIYDVAKSGGENLVRIARMDGDCMGSDPATCFPQWSGRRDVGKSNGGTTGGAAGVGGFFKRPFGAVAVKNVTGSSLPPDQGLTLFGGHKPPMCSVVIGAGIPDVLCAYHDAPGMSSRGRKSDRVSLPGRHSRSGNSRGGSQTGTRSPGITGDNEVGVKSALIAADPHASQAAIGVNGPHINILIAQSRTYPSIARIGGVAERNSTGKEIITSAPHQRPRIGQDASWIMKRFRCPGCAVEQVSRRIARAQRIIRDDGHEPVGAASPYDGRCRMGLCDSIVHQLPMESGWRAGGRPRLNATVDVGVIAARALAHSHQIDLAGGLIAGDGGHAVVGVSFRMRARERPNLREVVASVAGIMQAGARQGG